VHKLAGECGLRLPLRLECSSVLSVLCNAVLYVVNSLAGKCGLGSETWGQGTVVYSSNNGCPGLHCTCMLRCVADVACAQQAKFAWYAVGWLYARLYCHC
jgi:hypothetical protein